MFWIRKQAFKSQFRPLKNILGCLIKGTFVIFIIDLIIVYIIPKNYFEKSLQDTYHIKDFLDSRRNHNYSKLGEILFLDYDSPKPRAKEFKILVWKRDSYVGRQKMKYFSTDSHNPLDDCFVDNCKISYLDSDLDVADAVVFLLFELLGPQHLPDSSNRLPQQRWIFLTDKNPYNTFKHKINNTFSDYDGIFNWSITYRMDSDIPLPNGRTILFRTKEGYIRNKKTSQESLIPYYNLKQRKVLAASILYTCDLNSPEFIFLTFLQKIIDIDIYGPCTNNDILCPNISYEDCEHLNKYPFFITFESAKCSEYLTKNIFWNSYSKGAVPIVVGSILKDLLEILPPGSFLTPDALKTPQRLGKYIQMINNSWEKNYIRLHEWRNAYAVVNEHGYYGTRSFHYCRICEALNYNDEQPKIYEDLSHFLSPEKNCEK